MYKIYFILIAVGILIYSATTGFTSFKSGSNYFNPVFVNQQSTSSYYGNLSPSPNGINSVNTYTFSQSNTTYIPAYGGTLLCSSGCDDGYSNVTIPFSFTYNGTAYTAITVTHNGWMAFGTIAPGGLYTPICSGTWPNVISPFAYDLYGTGSTGDSLRWLTTGTAPNRVVTIEWSHWGFYSAALNELDFEIKLFETTNVVQFVYKPELHSTSETTITCGIMGTTNADFQTRTTTSNWAATTAGTTACSYCYFNSTVYPPSGLTFTWTPPTQSVPPPPVLISPANNSTGLPLTDTLIWSASTGATSYRVQLATDSLFTNLVVNDSLVTTTSRVVSGLVNNIKYYWRVNAKNSNGVSTYSPIWNFTVIITVPLLISPPNNSINVTLSPLLDWSDVAGATSYNLQVADNSSFVLPIIDLSSLTISQYQVPTGLLQGNTVYYWRASASNSIGTGNWSTVWNFTTLAAPNVPFLISPTNGSNILTLTPTLDWSDVTGAVSYTVQAATDTSFNNLAVNQGSLSTSQYSIPVGTLTGNTTYYWRAKAVNEAGSGPWSIRWNFRVVTLPPAPNLVAPPNNSTNQPTTVFLDWDSLAAANSYRIQLATDSLFNSLTYDTNGVIYSYLQIHPGILSPGTKYFWRVNAINLAGTGPWSEMWNFRVGTTGIYQYSNGIPKEYKLYNNYPNPFNPATNIKFDVPKSSFVKIKIYDITGKEIANLINMELKPGEYEISWNGVNFASGIYFYKIEAGDFTKVMRMMLIK